MRKMKMWKLDKFRFEKLYKELNHREYVHPDPLEFLYLYENPSDREIAGLAASSLAYGRVASILKNVSIVLDILGPNPSDRLKKSSYKDLRQSLGDFVHRFADADKTAAFLVGARNVVREYGSLYECFMNGQKTDDDTVFSGLCFFAETIRKFCPACPGHLTPLPRKRSACKRYNLYFRWMIRCDEVDPGGWDSGLSAKLIVPLDVHMHRIGTKMGFIRRRSADMKCALEMTDAFKKMSPEDPVRYDFSLTRLGIRKDMDLDSFLKS
jgi:uncharacterized protein (TIGR02757 family)